MLTIRERQMSVFAQVAHARFTEELFTLLLTTYPREARQAGGDRAFRRFVESGVERGTALGLRSEQQYSLYVALQLMLGAEFVSDPQIPWASRIHTAEAGAVFPVLAVFQEALRYLTMTAGRDCEYAVRAMLRVRRFRLEEAPTTSGATLVEDLLKVLRRFCPQKYDYQGEAVNRELIALSLQTARRYAITDSRGVFVFAALMFLTGSGFDRDPMYPWASEVLNDPELRDPSTRTEHLFEAAQRHIEESLQPDELDEADEPSPTGVLEK